MTTENHTHINYGDATLNQIIADLAWQVEQPNSHPVSLYMPLIQAIGRVLHRHDAQAPEARIMERLGLPHAGHGGQQRAGG